MNIGLEILVIVFLVLLNGCFSMSELAIVSARRARLQAMQRRGSAGASAAIGLAEDPQRFLPTVQVGITMVGIFAGAFGGAQLGAKLAEVLAQIPLLAPFAPQLALALVVLVITYLSLILGELVPKQIALRHPEGVAVIVARPLALIGRLTTPLIWLLSSSTAVILRLIGQSRPVDQGVTEEEVKAVVAEGAQSGVLETEERHMIERVLRLADKPVRALMTPRPEVAWLDRNADAAALAAKLQTEAVTRFIVADGRVDNVTGVIIAKDLLDQLLRGEAINLGTALRQPMILPDTLSALDAMERLKNDPLGLALVMDEYGSFEGVVTASDFLESIIGELGPTETPTPGDVPVIRHDGSLLIDGMLPSDELRARLDLPELPSPGTYHTTAGLMLALLQRVPKEGDRIAWAGWRFEIVDMDGRRVDKVLAVRDDSASGGP